MNAQRVHCPECGERVPVEHLALEAGWGKCVRCEVVFALERAIARSQ